jgi:glycosyltransferase involved in cell wall biosynthesis
MKIFISFLQSEQHYPIPAYGFWAYYIKNGIAEAGHEWIECPDADWALGLVPQSDTALADWKQISWSKTIAYLKKHPADLFLSYLYPHQIDIHAIADIKKMGIPCVNFFCDHVREFREVPFEFGAFDLNWVPEHKAINLYKKAGYPFINLPMPMWVDPLNRSFKEETNDQLTFIGSKDIQRSLLLENLVKRAPDLPLVVYGNGWIADNPVPQPYPAAYTFSKKLAFNINFLKNEGFRSFLRKLKHRGATAGTSPVLGAKTHSLLSADDYIKLTATSMITLGINRYPSFRFPLVKPDTYSRLRDIEAPMLGACYLTEWTEGIDELYDTQNEIAVYRNEAELINKIAELRADHDTRKKLKANGQKRALEKHSIPASLAKIKSKLNI